MFKICLKIKIFIALNRNESLHANNLDHINLTTKIFALDPILQTVHNPLWKTVQDRMGDAQDHIEKGYLIAQGEKQTDRHAH